MSNSSRNIAITAIGNIASPLAGFFSAPILAHALGVAGRGEVAASTAPLLLAVSAATLGMPEAVTFFTAQRRGATKSVLSRALLYLFIAGVAGIVVIAGLSLILAAGAYDLQLLMIVAALALPPALILSGVRGFAAGLGRWKAVAIERSLNSIFRLVVLGFLSIFGMLNAETATVTIAVASFIGLVAYVRLPRHARTSFSAGLERSSERVSVMGFGMRMWLGSLTGILLSRIDQLLMVPLSSTTELGLYAVAVSVSEVVLVFNGAVRDVMFSAESAKPSERRLSQASRISTFLTLVLAVLVGILAVPGLPWLFGADFSPAILITLILLVAVVAGNPGSVAGAGLSGRGRPGLRSVSLALAFGFNFVAIFLLVPTLGAIGAAVATLIGNFIAGYLNILWLRVFFGIPIRDFLGFRREDLRFLVKTLRGLRGGSMGSQGEADD